MTRDDKLIRTRLEDLQAEFEAGSRHVGAIEIDAGEMRDALLAKHLRQADIAGRLVRRIRELQACIDAQRERLRELRVAIRGIPRVR
jgi:hypothetical protein